MRMDAYDRRPMPVFVTATNVVTLHAAIKGEVTDMDNAIAQCVAAGKLTINDPDASAWMALRNRVDAYLAEEPSNLNPATQMLTGQQIQRDIAPFRERLTALGCKVGPTPEAETTPRTMDASPPILPSIFGGLGVFEKVMILAAADEFLNQGRIRKRLLR